MRPLGKSLFAWVIVVAICQLIVLALQKRGRTFACNYAGQAPFPRRLVLHAAHSASSRKDRSPSASSRRPRASSIANRGAPVFQKLRRLYRNSRRPNVTLRDGSSSVAQKEAVRLSPTAEALQREREALNTVDVVEASTVVFTNQTAVGRDLFEAAPRSAEAREAMREFFGAIDVDGRGVVKYDRMVEVAEQWWRGELNLTKDRVTEIRTDLTGLLVAMDHDGDGAVNLDECIDFLAALAEVQDSDPHDAEETSFQNRSQPFFGSLPRSFDMVAQDLRYTFDLVAKVVDNNVSLTPLEVSMLERTAQDVITCIPLLIIAMRPWPLIGHVLTFAFLGICTPNVLPSQFRTSRLELVRALQAVKEHPEYKAWSLYGEGPSEELDAALLSIFEAPPGSLAARSRTVELFEELDTDSSGNLTHSQVLGIIQAMWSGRLHLPKERMEDFRMDATLLMFSIDRANNGVFTLGQFAQYVETLVEVANAYTQEDVTVPDVQKEMLSGFDDGFDFGFAFTLAAQRCKFAAQGFLGSVSMFVRDIRYGFSLVVKNLKGNALSKMDCAVLQRMAKDICSMLPYALVAVSWLALLSKLLLMLFLKRVVPSLFPSAFRKSRRRLAQAWWSIAASQRARVVEDWAAFEDNSAPIQMGDTALAMLEAPTSPSTRACIHQLFDHLDTCGSGTLTYGTVLGIVRAISIAGPWALSYKMDDSGRFLDAMALMIQMDKDDDGAITRAELTEYLMTWLTVSSFLAKPVEVVHPTTLARPLSAFERLKALTAARLSKIKACVQREVRELVDCLAMFGRDVAYAVSLIRKSKGCKILARSESAMLRRTALDFLLFVPIAVVIVAPLTPIGTALVIALMKRYIPRICPSSFRKDRLELMRGWRQVKTNLQRV